MLGGRYSQYSFAQVPDIATQRSQFDRSHTVKDTIDFDYLTPIYIDEVIPGDTINLNLNSFIRLSSPLKVPVMDNLYVDYFFFYVPMRLLWDNYRKFYGEQINPGDSTDFTIPQVESTVSGWGAETIFDHFGLPLITGAQSVNALPFRAYALIWNEWFRDQNSQDSFVFPLDDGPDSQTVIGYQLLKRGKRHDYFTSCLPWPQKGDPIMVPLGDSAPVVSTGAIPRFSQANTGDYGFAAGFGGASTTYLVGGSSSPGDLRFGTVTGLETDLSSATAATINQLRDSFLLQGLFELDARAGTRYTEIIRAHFNVMVADLTYRPEFLGGGSTRINMHPVAQTSPTSGSNPQGQLAAFATSSANGVGFTKSFTEPGYVIGLACPRADITYQQGLNKMWTRQTRFDFFYPKLQQLGEQAVLNKEIYYQGTSQDEEVFGYQERYAEYKYKPSEIRGQFRSTFATPLDMWHMAEDYDALPDLTDGFIEQQTPIERAMAVTTAPHLLCDFWFNIKHARPMMLYSIPATLGRI